MVLTVFPVQRPVMRPREVNLFIKYLKAELHFHRISTKLSTGFILNLLLYV